MKLLFDLFPLLIFFGAFKFYDIYIATAAAIVATFVQVGVFWARKRRIEPIHIMTLGVITVFGGLTIALQDDLFIKWKPTVINWLFALAIAAMLFVGQKSALERLMGRQIALPAAAWRTLNWAWAGFFFALGALNLYVAFFYDPGAPAEVRTETWVRFKVFGMLALTVLFVLAQGLYLTRHMEPVDPGEDA